jgi:hypothetical protein
MEEIDFQLIRLSIMEAELSRAFSEIEFREGANGIIKVRGNFGKDFIVGHILSGGETHFAKMEKLIQLVPEQEKELYLTVEEVRRKKAELEEILELSLG